MTTDLVSASLGTVVNSCWPIVNLYNIFASSAQKYNSKPDYQQASYKYIWSVQYLVGMFGGEFIYVLLHFSLGCRKKLYKLLTFHD
jgi:hypothetical protein